MTFSDYAEVAPGLFVGAHPEPEDPFDLGANVVVCLASVQVGTRGPDWLRGEHLRADDRQVSDAER